MLELSSEAACSHIVELAKAEVNGNPNASKAVKEFANISLAHAESGCHVLFRKHGFVAAVQPKHLDLGGRMQKFPFVPFSSFVKLLLDTGMLPQQLCGCVSFDAMSLVLEEFWSRYFTLHPRHPIFEMAHQGQLVLSHTVPVFSHSDEGRSAKHQPIMIVSTHGCIGRGTRSYIEQNKHLVPLNLREMGLNFVGSTWSTQFMSAAVLRQVLEDDAPGSFDIILQAYAEDMASLATSGLVSGDGQKKVWIMHLGNKGDLPALKKLSGTKRSYSQVPRQPSSRKACAGVCHICLAGVESYGPESINLPFEDFGMNPCWGPTVNLQVPWDSLPTILQGLPRDESQDPSFFCTDIWHNCHLGVIKHWFASAIVCMLEKLNKFGTGSVEKAFEYLTQDFANFCQRRKIKAHEKEINKEVLSWAYSSVCPVGRWSKGLVATQFMGYLEDLATRKVIGQSDDALLNLIAPWREVAALSCSGPFLVGLHLRPRARGPSTRP